MKINNFVKSENLSQRNKKKKKGHQTFWQIERACFIGSMGMDAPALMNHLFHLKTHYFHQYVRRKISLRQCSFYLKLILILFSSINNLT